MYMKIRLFHLSMFLNSSSDFFHPCYAKVNFKSLIHLQSGAFNTEEPKLSQIYRALRLVEQYSYIELSPEISIS